MGGGPLPKDNLSRRSWGSLRARAGLGDVRFHDLRHIAASLLLSKGCLKSLGRGVG